MLQAAYLSIGHTAPTCTTLKLPQRTFSASMAGTSTHTSPVTLHYYKNNFARDDASLPQTKLTFRNNNAVLEYKQLTILHLTTVTDEAVVTKKRDTTKQQATDISRKGVQKKWKVGINEKENEQVKNKFNRTTPSRREGSHFTLHTFYNFIVSFPITPFFLSSPPCLLLQTFRIHILEHN
jgi:hypothetical protein